MSRLTIALRYIAFAIVSVIANLAIQRLILNYTPLGLLFALLGGTGVGLIVKYLLDRKWIFQSGPARLREHGRSFTLYSATGVLTTALFWSLETGAWFIWETETAREAGALLGLGLGYILKYQLDRKLVFQTSAGATEAST